MAKYATKSTEALGVTLDHRIGEVELEGLDVPAHVAELVRACWELGGRPALARLRLRKWAHMLGFGGHFSTKSRRYSTTLGALRRARVAYAIRRRRGDTLPLDAWGRPEDDQAVIVVASWSYLGSGYQTHRGGVAGRLGGCSGAGSAADRQGGATHHDHDRRMRHRSRTGVLDRLLTVEEAAERLGTSARFVRRLMLSGASPTSRSAAMCASPPRPGRLHRLPAGSRSALHYQTAPAGG